MISNLDAILGSLAIDKDAFIEAMQSETDVELQFSKPSLESFSPDAFADDEKFQTFKRNFAEEQKTAGVEMAVKSARNELGLDFEGKTIPNLIKAVTHKVESEATLEPDKKVQQYKADVDSLKSQLESVSLERDSFKGQISEIQSNHKLERSLYSNIKDESNYSIPADDLVALYKMKTNIGIEEGSHVLYEPNGDIMKNDLREPISVESHFSEFTKSYLKNPTGGSGGADETPVGKRSLNEYANDLIAEGLQPNSADWNARVSEAVKSGLVDL
jgi:hypothetical protein